LIAAHSSNDEVIETVKSFGIQPKRTSFRSPWQNCVAERWVCTCRRDLLMNEYVLYYLEDRTHLALEKETPAGREAREDPGGGYNVISMPRLGGLHHRYIVLPELLLPTSLVKN
jgi:putative transposase